MFGLRQFNYSLSNAIKYMYIHEFISFSQVWSFHLNILFWKCFVDYQIQLSFTDKFLSIICTFVNSTGTMNVRMDVVWKELSHFHNRFWADSSQWVNIDVTCFIFHAMLFQETQWDLDKCTKAITMTFKTLISVPVDGPGHQDDNLRQCSRLNNWDC